jgi:dipeptidyl aminopeptidase/acylaminoacyl peptidase
LTASAWSPDGRFLLYITSGGKSGHDIWVLPLAQAVAPLTPYRWMRTDFNEQHVQFSPDGRWVVYQSNESGRYEIYVAPFPGPGAKQLVSRSGGILARWGRDGKEIFYLGFDQKLWAVTVAAKGAALETGEARPLFGSLMPGEGYPYDVSADGQRFLAAMPPEEDAGQELTVVQNWLAGLKR